MSKDCRDRAIIAIMAYTFTRVSISPFFGSESACRSTQESGTATMMLEISPRPPNYSTIYNL